MSVCGVCNKNCDLKSECIKCVGGCEIYFHQSCVKEDTDGRKTRSFKDWKCRDCRSQTSSAQSAVSGTALTKESLTRILDDFKKSVFAELRVFRDEMSGLAESVQFLSGKVDESNTLISEMRKEFASLKKETTKLREEHVEMANTITLLRERVRDLEQYTRRNNIEISGVPVTAKEDVTSLVKDVGRALGVDVSDSDIAAAHRVPSYNKQRTPSLVVQLQNRSLKDTWTSKYRERKVITAYEINPVFPKSNIFVNDHLSPENKLFLSKLKMKCKDIGYAFAWCRDGKFFVRKAQGERYKRIVNNNDIDNLK